MKKLISTVILVTAFSCAFATRGPSPVIAHLVFGYSPAFLGQETDDGEAVIAPASASSWFEGDLNHRWAEIIADIEKFGPAQALGRAEGRVIDDPHLFAEAQSAFFHNLPLLNKVLMARVREQGEVDFMRGPEWTLEVRLYAEAFPAAYAISQTYNMTFQLALPNYAPILRRVEAAANLNKFGTYENPEAEVTFFDAEDREIKPTGNSFDEYCRAPLISRMVWLITPCVTPECPDANHQYRYSYEECSDGTSRRIIGCFFTFISCPR